MSPLVLPHTRSLLDTQPSQAPAFMSTTAGRVVFILCIVFGSLLLCMLVVLSVYCVRRHNRKKRDSKTLDLHREASFIAGAPSVIDIVPPPQPARRPSTRNALPRIVIPSPELGSVFRLDTMPNLPRRGSSAVTRSRSGTGSPTPKAMSPHYESLFSGTSTVITSGMEKYDVPLRVMNHSSLASTATVEPHLQKPIPVYRTGRNSSQVHLVSSKASADSLFSGSTNTPPLSPATWSHSGTINSPTDVSLSTTATVHKSASRQSFSTAASSPPRVAVRCIELPPDTDLMDAEQTPRAHSPSSRPPPADQFEQPLGMTGTPITLSHFPFRFSCGAPSSPGLSAMHGSPVPSSSLGALSPHRSIAQLSTPASQLRPFGLEEVLAESQPSLPVHSTPAIKLKLKHHASDEIIAVAFAPQSISFAAVADAVRGRLGFEPRRVWSDEGMDVTNDASLWSWLDAQYTHGHTRLMLHVE